MSLVANRRGLTRTQLIVLGLALAGVGVIGAAVIRGGGGGMVTATIPAGTRLVASLGGSVSTRSAEAGTPITLQTVEAISLGDGAEIPAGLTVRGEVTHSKGGGRIEGAPELTLRFQSLEVEGERHAIAAEPFRVKGKSDAKESAALIGGGTVVGGVVGAIAGNTVAGAVVGGVLGTGAALAQDGDDITLPSGQRLRIRLTEPVTVRYRPAPPAN